MQCQGCLGGKVIAGVGQGNVALWGSLTSWLPCMDCVPTGTIKAEEDCKTQYSPASPTLERIPAVPCPLGIHLLRLINGFSAHAVQKPSNHCFSLFPRVAESAHKSLSYIPSSCRLKAEGQSSHWYHISESPTHLYVFPLSFFVQKVFNKPSAIFQEQLLFTQMQIWCISGRR